MSAPIITVEGLGKRYTLHHQARSGLLRDQLASLLRNPFRRQQRARNTQEEFWALKDVNFTVNQGDVLGIIGRNGAGKSTLLKILSRIIEPTTGRITIQGRVASLLEVGTGFHGELSGRENIYLNGAILGMKRAEIRKKFDEIVAFSEVEKFLDTPVKHYSSGMYVRLAFAVAAHLEPEILIVDEVLAVGDAAFQKKCLGKMQDVARTEGRTVLFVSHNMEAVINLCTSAILLENGQTKCTGPTDQVQSRYLQENEGKETFEAPTTKTSGIRRINVCPPTAQCADLAFKIHFHCINALNKPNLGLVVYNLHGNPLFGTNSQFHPWLVAPQSCFSGTVLATIRDVPLWTGIYKTSFWLSDGQHVVDTIPDAVIFEVVNSRLPANAPPAKDIGHVHVRGHWQIVT